MLLIILVVLTAAFLRFWDFTHLPFMHDEFSAIFRAGFETFNELIEKGVMPDAHPPGVQLFIYFLIKLFGVHEPVLKFPFLLMGTGSIVFSFLVAKRWFGFTTAILSSSLLSVLQYNIFYSQIIRPYEAGLFFSLGTVYFWTKVVFDKNLSKNAIFWFVVFFTFNNYIHAFTIFFNVLIAVTGLLFLKGKQLKTYLFSGFISLFFSFPSLYIFFFQLKRGGIGGWLGVPDKYFILEYFKYIFHFSMFFFSVVLFVAFYLAYKKLNKNPESEKFRWISISWFFVTFFTAYLYSVLRIPVIQYSTLYFVFPFLVMLLFSFAGKVNAKLLILSVLVILFTGISTLVMDRDYYRLMFHQGLNEIPRQVLNDIKTTELSESAIVLQAHETGMFDFYFNKYGKKPDYFKLEKKGDLKHAFDYIEKKKSQTIIVGIADYAPFYFVESAKSYFPYVIKRITSQNMEYWVLSKNKNKNYLKSDSFSKMIARSGSFVMSVNEQYKGDICLMLDTIKYNDFSVLNVKAEIVTDSIVPDATLVFDWKTADGKPFFWAGSAFKDFYFKSDSSYFVDFSTRIMNFNEMPLKGRAKFYVWKRDKSEVRVKNIKVYLTEMDAVEFGLFRKIR